MVENGKKIYLGDSVYGQWINNQLVLTTENGSASSNTIVLEPEVITALFAFVEDIKTAAAEAQHGTVQG